MKKAAQADDLGEGVLYASEACAGLVSRLLILVIDLFVLLVCGIVLQIIWHDLLPTDGDPNFGAFWSWGAVSYIYLVLVESSVGTLGFLITGAKIVNLNGEKPSILRMTGRLCLWLVGPFNLLIDLLWVTTDRHKQTLRDKLAGTYVVKKGAVPCGRGRIRAVHYFLFGLSILFPEVREQPPSS